MTSKYTDLGKNNIELLMFPVGLQTFKALSGDKKKKVAIHGQLGTKWVSCLGLVYLASADRMERCISCGCLVMTITLSFPLQIGRGVSSISLDIRMGSLMHVLLSPCFPLLGFLIIGVSVVCKCTETSCLRKHTEHSNNQILQAKKK